MSAITSCSTVRRMRFFSVTHLLCPVQRSLMQGFQLSASFVHQSWVLSANAVTMAIASLPGRSSTGVILLLPCTGKG